jgi:hypothetical protein
MMYSIEGCKRTVICLEQYGLSHHETEPVMAIDLLSLQENASQVPSLSGPCVGLLDKTDSGRRFIPATFSLPCLRTLGTGSDFPGDLVAGATRVIAWVLSSATS